MPVRPSCRSRRPRREGDSRLERIRAEAELSSGEPPTSLAAAAAQQMLTPAPPSRWPFHAAVVTSGIAALAFVYLAGPLAIGMAWYYPLTAAVAAAASGLVAWTRRGSVSQRAQVIPVSVVAAVVALFALGASTQVVVNGTPHLASSETAQAYHLIRDIEQDLHTLFAYDDLILADQTTARADIGLYEPAQLRMADLRAKYAAIGPEEVPNDAFLPIVRSVAAGADFGSRAVEGRRNLALQYDARLEADVSSYRDTYAEQVLSAGQQLNGVAALYDIMLDEGRPTE